MGQQLLQQGIIVDILNGVPIGTPINSEFFGIPGKALQNVSGGSLTWQTIFTGSPSAVSLDIQGTNDNGATFVIVDATTLAAGEARTISPLPNFRLWRVRLISNTGGTLATVKLSIG